MITGVLTTGIRALSVPIRSEPIGCEQNMSTMCFDATLSDLSTDIIVPLRILQKQNKSFVTKDIESDVGRAARNQSQFNDVTPKPKSKSGNSSAVLQLANLESDVLCMSGTLQVIMLKYSTLVKPNIDKNILVQYSTGAIMNRYTV